MNEHVKHFLASARSLALSPLERAEVRASIVAEMVEVREARAILEGSADAFRLTDYEKAIGRARLRGFMDAHPLRTQRASLFDLLFLRFAPAAFASVFSITIIGVGFAYAAEGALPGDLLYPIKTHITEPLISSFASSTAKQAQWDVQRIERRLEEASALERRAPQHERRLLLRSQMEEDADNLQKRLSALPTGEQQIVRDSLVSGLTRRQQSLLQVQSTTGVPSALKTLVEDAARDDQEIDTAVDEASPPSSQAPPVRQNDKGKEMRETKDEEKFRFALPSDKEARKESVIPQSSSSSSEETSSREERGDSSASQEEEPAAPSIVHEQNPAALRSHQNENDGEDRHRGRQGDDARALLRLLEESSSSSEESEQSIDVDDQPTDSGQGQTSIRSPKGKKGENFDE